MQKTYHKIKTNILTLMSISALDCAAHSMNSLSPFAVESLIKNAHLTIKQTSIWSSTEMLFYALSMIIIGKHSLRLNLPFISFISGLLIIISQTISSFSYNFEILIILRIFSGIGLGTLNAVVNIAASYLKHPIHTLSFVMIIQTIIFSTASFILPYIENIMGQQGTFLTLGLIIILLLPFFKTIPNIKLIPPHQPHSNRKFPIINIISLMAVACYTAGTLAIWPFSEPIATSIGITTISFGYLSSLANIIGLIFCFLNIHLNRKNITIKILIPMLILTGVMCIIQTSACNTLSFYIAFLLNYGLWFFIYPSIIGLICLLDSTGKLASYCGGAWMLSQTFITLISGSIAENGNYKYIGFLSFLLCLISSYCIYHLIKKNNFRVNES